MKDDTHQAHTQSFQQGEYKMMIMAARRYSGSFAGLKFPDICLTGEEKPPKKTSPRTSVPTGDRTRARSVTGVHATACSTGLSNILYNNHVRQMYINVYRPNHVRQMYINVYKVKYVFKYVQYYFYSPIIVDNSNLIHGPSLWNDIQLAVCSRLLEHNIVFLFV